MNISNVEKEFGEPFKDILEGFAADGESLEATARIIGFSGTRLRILIRKLELKINWPKPTESNGWRNANRNYGTGAHLRAAQANIRKAWLVNKAKHEAMRKTTPEVMQKAIALHDKGFGWRQIPRMLDLDIHPTTLRRCYKRHYEKGKNE